MSSLQLLVNSRKYVRGQVTKNFNKRNELSNLNEVDKASRKIKFKAIAERLESLDDEIMKLEWSDNPNETSLNIELEICEEYSDKINELISLVESNSSSASNTTCSNTTHSLLRRPTAPLPLFESKPNDSIDTFLYEFEQTIKSFNFSDRDKTLLLKQQVKGRAGVLLDSLEVDKQTYDDATNLLRSALATPSLQKFNLIKQLAQMKLDSDTEPFNYISLMRNIKESVKTLKLEVDDFLRYFYWEGLNENFKSHFVTLTNNIRPELNDLFDKFFIVSERYMNGKEVKSKPKSTNSLAVNVNFNKSKDHDAKFSYKESAKDICLFCDFDSKYDEINHLTSRCPVYSTAQAKVDKLKLMKACLKCMKTNHTFSECKFKLHKKCFLCSGWHFTFLCVRGAEKTEPQSVGGSTEKQSLKNTESKVKDVKHKESKIKEVKGKETSVSTVVYSGYHPSDNDETVLPTFTSLLGDGSRVRGLRDGGSQGTFVSEKLFNKHKFKVLQKDVPLTITGFNSSYEYNSKQVEFDIQLGQEIQTIQAWCVPSIQINLDLPNLNIIVKEFTKKGYNLADKELLNGADVINDLDLVLGTNFAYCILSNSVSFGSPKPSVYLNSSIGVIILGKIDEMLNNLEMLPYNCSDNKGQTCISYFSNFVKKPVCDVGLIDNNSFDNLNLESVPSSSNINVLDEKGEIIEASLSRALKESIDNSFLDNNTTNIENDELNDMLVNYALNNVSRKPDGRIVLPLLWNSKVCDFLGKNFNLAKSVLNSNLRKLKDKPELLNLMDDSFMEQQQLGIIEAVPDVDVFMQENPKCSFLAHMGVFKLNRETTKCRVVFLSNICEKIGSQTLTVSHNMAIHPGPCLNQKIVSALLHSRFGSKMFIFDIGKAFNQIELNSIDQTKLMFLWFRNVKKQDFSIVAYRNLRLSFGLRCSPTLLMLAFYKILILDIENDDSYMIDVKKIMYQLIYMDNGAYCTDNIEKLKFAYDKLNEIFSPYRMPVQQIA